MRRGHSHKDTKKNKTNVSLTPAWKNKTSIDREKVLSLVKITELRIPIELLYSQRKKIIKNNIIALDSKKRKWDSLTREI